MAEVSRVRVGGPLEPYADGFRASLAQQGYRPSSAGRILRLMARFSSWLDAQSLSAGGFTIEDAGRFELACGAPAARRGRLSGPMNRVVDHLIQAGVAVPAPAAVPGAAEVLLAGYGAYLTGYGAYLTGERGLAARSVCGYLRDAGQFLAWRCGRCGGDVALGTLTARDVTDFVLAEHRRGSVASARRVVNAMRSFLGYLHVEGLTAGPLTSAVLSVPGWRGTSPPPEPLTPAEVKRLLPGFDQRSHLGRRDYAMVLVMLRLGLRAAEVAGLDAGDINWRQGEVIVSGKGHRRDRLPLPAEVGHAIAAYCEQSRPRVSNRALFLRGRAPHDRLSPSAVSHVVHRAGARAGIPGVAAHRLRHTVASDMLRAGASLFAIGGVLRQRRLATTAVYAKAGQRDLSLVARPWPGGAA
jgi:integrase/recombinase XerD